MGKLIWFYVQLGLYGCVTITAIPRSPREPIGPERVTVYREHAGPYEEVARIMVSGDVHLMPNDKLHDALRDKAGSLGANGVILGPVTGPERIAIAIHVTQDPPSAQ